MRLTALLLLLLVFCCPAAGQAQVLTLEIKDYVTMPMTGMVQGKTSNEMLLARVNTIREEPQDPERSPVVPGEVFWSPVFRFQVGI